MINGRIKNPATRLGFSYLLYNARRTASATFEYLNIIWYPKVMSCVNAQATGINTVEFNSTGF